MVSIYSYKLTVSNGRGGSFAFGIYMYIGLYIYRSIIALVFWYKLTILNGVSLIDIGQQRVHSFHWQFQMGEGVHLPLVSMCALVSIYSYNLTVSNGKGGGHLPLVSICVHWSLYILIS